MGASSPIELAAEMVAAFVANNPLPKSEPAALVYAVYATVTRLAGEPNSAPLQIEPKAPAAPIRRSVTPDFLICLEDRKRFKSMRRHLAGLGITPHQYREKWNLPADYPMVAPNYAAQRSAMAKEAGLGRIHPARSLRSQPSVGRKPRRRQCANGGQHFPIACRTGQIDPKEKYGAGRPSRLGRCVGSNSEWRQPAGRSCGYNPNRLVF